MQTDLSLTVPQALQQALLSLSIPVHLTGFRLLCIATVLFAADPDQCMCTQLYPAVAQTLGYMDWRAIEYAIRRAILAGWKHRDTDTWARYFPGLRRAPSNKQFIATLAMYIK